MIIRNAIRALLVLGAPPPSAEPRDHRLVVVVLPAGVCDFGRFLAAAGEDGGSVAWAFAGPEAGGVVVGGADEEMAEGVEGEGPDVGVVGLGEGGAGWGEGWGEGWIGDGEVPVEDGAFGAAGDDEGVDRVPGHGCKGGGVCVCGVEEEGGRRDVQQTSFLWPLRIQYSFIARMSKTRTVWSLEALATMLPFGDQERAWIVFLW